MTRIKDYFKKVAFNFRCDYALLSSRSLEFFDKLAYIARRYAAILLNKRKIKYLGSEFCYDNRFSPAQLGVYPREIEDINGIVKLKKIKTVLDVGANIGQFGYTLKKFYPNIQLYSFEPNKEIFPLTKKNAERFENWKVFNYGLGNKDGKLKFYFSPSASPEGSFYKSNVHQSYNRGDIKETEIDVVKLSKSMLKKLKIPGKLDLVKIDVEGAEIEVLKSLGDLNFKYLFIEISVKREGEGGVETVKGLIKKIWKRNSKILYYHMPSKDAVCANVMFELE